MIEKLDIPQKLYCLIRVQMLMQHIFQKLSEYILNETGSIYRYYENAWHKLPWIYGLFHPKILDIVLYLLEQTSLNVVERGDM
ncbi:hypothetical protein B4U80_14382 [Leptotrombidium deliense]|uniref:Uncharacterized protein n=1 Tax=Leptotrombidium deliense TaxID=299467 RepID=A0A443RWG6_9ACAR|nr:hypothetical protein B4U80_14382 [Leptotrombidium deliense]